MKNIEKSLTNFVKGKKPTISEESICAFANKNANEIINILFKVINEELDSIKGTESIGKIKELFRCINIVITNFDDVNRKIVSRKLQKLDEKISRLKEENKYKFANINKAHQELEEIRKELENIEKTSDQTETKQYAFIHYLVDAIKNITYLEYAFNKMPHLINVKDKREVSLIQNIIEKYIECVKQNDEDILYYNNLITLILSHKNFHISEKERKNCLEMIYKNIDKLSIGKKQLKKNRKKIDYLINIAESIKGNEETEQKIDLLASKYNISVFFDEDILAQAKLVKTPKTGIKTDRKISNDYIISIDKDNAIEIDDALSCRKLPNGNYLLGVHIASILGYFPYDSNIVEEAINRNRSIYLPKKYQSKDNDFNRTIPIFPYDFSANIGSLIVGDPKLARSYYFEIDEFGNIVNEEFVKTIITNNKKMTYTDVDKVLKNGSKDKKLEETIQNLQIVTDLLDKKYKGTDLYEQVKENTDDYSDLRVKRIGAEKIVYQSMLLTGNRVAEFFANPERGYPCLYRVHEVNEDNTKKIKAMIDNLTKTYGGEQYQKLYQLIQGLYPKGWYDTKGPHSGLGLDHYCHCTSGLRRAADIIVEHALEVCHDKQPTDNELKELEKEIEKRKIEINSKQDPIEWFIRDYKRAYQKRK